MIDFVDKLRTHIDAQCVKLEENRDYRSMLKVLKLLVEHWDRNRLSQSALVNLVPFAGKDPQRDARQAVEYLRKDWLVPILSTAHKPQGYWLPLSQEEVRRWLEQQINTVRSTYTSSLETHCQVALGAGLDPKLFDFSQMESRFELRAVGKPGKTLKSEKRAHEFLRNYCEEYGVTEDQVILTEYTEGRIICRRG